MGDISTSLESNRETVQKQIADCDDILLRPMELGKEVTVACFLIYIEVAVSNMMLEDSVIGKMLNHLKEMDKDSIYQSIKQNSLGVSDTKELETMQEAMAAMLAGNVVLFIDGYDKAIKVGSKGYPAAGISKAESEKVLRGSKEAFSESVKINTALIRKRVRDTKLKVKEKVIGKHSNTATALVYIDDLAYPSLLDNIEKKLDSFEIDGVLDSGIIEQLTEESWYSPFPQYQTTERPDRAAMAVMEGRVVLLSDNSPEALILPTTWNTLFQTSDDYYSHFTIASFLRLIRYVAAFLAVSLPGLYLIATNFHTQMLPTNLVISLAKARAGVPFPSLLEVLIMELSFELIREAGLRVPGPIGNTIGIVGGLIIGQAAVAANIVSPIIVVVVALTALGSFSIPNEEVSGALRLIKYGMIFFCNFWGVLGLLFGWFLILVHLAGLKSFDIPYLIPFTAADINQDKDKADSIFRRPIFQMNRRPVFARRHNRVRLRMK